jgi:NADP-dependent 3-hydroxy acid dehydrogenase YdfG
VTGASGAIGGAVARRLADEGVHLVLSGRDRLRLEQLAEDVSPCGVDVALVDLDLTSEGAIETLAGVAEGAGGVDLLVHALGLYHAAPIAETPVAVLDRQLDVNLRVPYTLTRRLLGSLRRRQGQVVFVNSTVGRAAKGGLTPYAAAKHALRAVADGLRDEVNTDGVRVLTVYPGRTAGAMQEEVCRLAGEPYRPERLLQPDDVAAVVLCCLTLPRNAEVTELTIRPMRKG